MSDTASLLRECIDVLEGVNKGVDYAYKYFSGSQVAEVRAFFNGYAGAPNIDTLLPKLRELENGS